MKKYFNFYIKTRLRGIWMLLTKKYVVVLSANDPNTVTGVFNTTYPSYVLMTQMIAANYKKADDKMEDEARAKDIVKKMLEGEA